MSKEKDYAAADAPAEPGTEREEAGDAVDAPAAVDDEASVH